jgi:hypothetical protein
VLRHRSRLEAAAQKADQFERDVEDAAVLIEFAVEDAASLAELRATVERLEREI